jgi:hypothetical protein
MDDVDDDGCPLCSVVDWSPLFPSSITLAVAVFMFHAKVTSLSSIHRLYVVSRVVVRMVVRTYGPLYYDLFDHAMRC